MTIHLPTHHFDLRLGLTFQQNNYLYRVAPAQNTVQFQHIHYIEATQENAWAATQHDFKAQQKYYFLLLLLSPWLV